MNVPKDGLTIEEPAKGNFHVAKVTKVYYCPEQKVFSSSPAHVYGESLKTTVETLVKLKNIFIAVMKTKDNNYCVGLYKDKAPIAIWNNEKSRWSYFDEQDHQITVYPTMQAASDEARRVNYDLLHHYKLINCTDFVKEGVDNAAPFE